MTQKWKSALLGAVAMIAAGGSAQAATCGTSWLGGPETMPVVVNVWNEFDASWRPSCFAQASWYTFWDGVPVVARSAKAPVDTAGGALTIPTMTLESDGAGWPGKVTDVSVVRVRLDGNLPIISFGMGMYSLREVRFGTINAQGVPAGAIETIIPADRSTSPTYIGNGALADGVGWSIGRENDAVVEFRRPTLVGDYRHLFDLPIGNILETP